MAINLLSPIARMPFGPEKGTLIWQLPINTFSWLRRQVLTEACKQVLDEAWDMYMHEGQYAILRRDPHIMGKVTLVSISKDFPTAHLMPKDVNEFVYCISSKVNYEKQTAQSA